MLSKILLIFVVWIPLAEAARTLRLTNHFTEKFEEYAITDIKIKTDPLANPDEEANEGILIQAGEKFCFVPFEPIPDYEQYHGICGPKTSIKVKEMIKRFQAAQLFFDSSDNAIIECAFTPDNKLFSFSIYGTKIEQDGGNLSSISIATVDNLNEIEEEKAEYIDAHTSPVTKKVKKTVSWVSRILSFLY